MKFKKFSLPNTSPASGRRARWPILIEYFGSLLFLIGVGGVLAWALQQQKQSVLAESQQAQATLARVAEAQLVNTLRSSEYVLAELAKLYGNNLLVSEALRPDFWQGVWRALPESSFQFATDEQGKIVAASQSNLLGQVVDTREYFRKPREFQDSLRMFISSPEQVLNDERAIVLSRSVHDAHNMWRGVVAVVLPCAKFQQVLEQFRISATQTAALMDESGTLIARAPLPRNYAVPLIMSANNAIFSLHQQSGLPFSFHAFSSSVDGTDKIGAALTINTSPIQTDQSLVLTVSELSEVVLAPWYRMLNVFWGYLIMVLITIWFGFISYRRRRDNEAARILIDALLTNPTVAVVGVRANGVICLFSPAATTLTGYSSQEALGKNWFELCCSPNEGTQLHTLFDQAKASSLAQGAYENKILTRTGETRIVAWRISMICDHKGVMAVGWGVDITQARQREVVLRNQAQIDVLTGVPNRRHFLDLANKGFSQACRHGYCLSVLMLDIDHFKRVNDTYGHHMGDLVLQNFARKCSEMLREEDLLGRLGGEEFGVVLLQTDGSAAATVAERIRQNFAASRTILESGEIISCTVSIGVAELGTQNVSFEDLLQQADQALYAAKHGGRNRVVLDLAPQS